MTQGTPTRWSEFDRYLRGEHLQGRRATLTIERATTEKTFAGGAPVVKPCLWFKGTSKGLLLNTGNRRKLVTLFGDDVAGAMGRQIIVEPHTVKVRGEDVLTVRIVGANGNGQH